MQGNSLANPMLQEGQAVLAVLQMQSVTYCVLGGQHCFMLSLLDVHFCADLRRGPYWAQRSASAAGVAGYLCLGPIVALLLAVVDVL